MQTVRKIIDKYRHFFEMSIFVYYGEILRKTWTNLDTLYESV